MPETKIQASLSFLRDLHEPGPCYLEGALHPQVVIMEEISSSTLRAMSNTLLGLLCFPLEGVFCLC